MKIVLAVVLVLVLDKGSSEYDDENEDDFDSVDLAFMIIEGFIPPFSCYVMPLEGTRKALSKILFLEGRAGDHRHLSRP